MGDDPRVQFGMECLSQALNAKSGRIDASATGLPERAKSLLADDPDALCAAREFVDRLDTDPTDAGDFLMHFLSEWAPLPVPAPQGSPDWFDRKDCGHD